MALWNDLRYAARTLLREPGFAVVAVLTLALGIGANTAIFSIVNGVLLRPLPYREPERLVAVREMIPAMARLYPVLPVSPRHFVEWRQRASSFERLSVIRPGAATNLTGAGEPEQVGLARVSANLLTTLGVQPALGRAFAEGEDQKGHESVVLISDSLWRRRFHSDPSIIGKPLALDGEPHTIIGVLPPLLRYPGTGFEIIGQRAMPPADVLRPMVFTEEELKDLMGHFNYEVIARLKRGVTREQALAELNLIDAQLVKMSGEKIELRALVTPMQESLVGRSRRGLLLLLGAVASVLLIVCVNLASLMLARAERRGRESAIRTALGASRGRLVRHALVESLLIALLGGALGVALAASGLGALVKSAPPDIPRLEEVRLDGRVLLFVLAITTATGLLFGLAPAWRTARTDPQSELKAGGRTSTGGAGGLRLRGALVSAEVALGTLLLITAGLLTTGFVRLLRTDKGFNAPTVLAAKVVVPFAKYTQNQDRSAFYERVLSRLAAQPGVLSAAMVSVLPLQGEGWIDAVSLPGDSRPTFERPMVNVRFISPDYFRTMGVPLLAGRTFNESDRKRQVAIISERFAGILWPGQEPVGRQFFTNGSDGYEVIGVVGDVRAEAHKPPPAMEYRPHWDYGFNRVEVVARAAGDPRSIAAAMRAAVRAVDPDVPVAEVRTMQEVLGESVAQRRFQMLLALAFAVVALLLASLGIYGVVSYSVARRTHEMGIRTALGARSSQLLGMVLRQGIVPVAAGLGAGVAGALAAGHVLSSLLFEVSARDPLTISAAAALLFVVGFAACYIPARRATKVDPLVALRFE